MDPPGHRDVEAGDERALMGATEARGGRVLVVDDDPLVCETVSETLQTVGYVALCAGDAAAALPVLRRAGEVDLLLTDFSMPGMNQGNRVNGYATSIWTRKPSSHPAALRR